MVINFYASWCPGIALDKKALNLIKNSKIFKGIETCDLNDEIKLIKKEGLRTNIHNPLRRFQAGLEDRNFKKLMNSDRINLAKTNDEAFMGFHSCYRNLERSHSLIFARFRHYLNVSFLRKKLNKKIIFESPPYVSHINASKKVVSLKFVEKLLNCSDGYLFDVSHNFVTMKSLEKEGIKSYRKGILAVTRGKVLQMHLNCPFRDIDGNFMDRHLTFSGKKYEEEVLDFAREVIKNNPQLEVITLEMTTNLLPEEHVKVLIKQAKYLKKKLGL